ncbi:unnamed protein product (macronuclear) [Paramecium tetraurelia]|uniref:Uncharacterized protein n=1 Tax=Paramecium tetraurelia TaxID=5888 RepID=A0DLJ1_PARTE|nr:uncharacterized protein GSPATT00018225001 [Paramecium tetraurelia]CAK83908.1 unnamed protein product [Paramecium tetraurelia]|eukprot:XP_001451305.1 hypothetical protein (macronuclear) [Paramecium tetraurelia strain d4-2]
MEIIQAQCKSKKIRKRTWVFITEMEQENNLQLNFHIRDLKQPQLLEQVQNQGLTIIQSMEVVGNQFIIGYSKLQWYHQRSFTQDYMLGIINMEWSELVELNKKDIQSRGDLEQEQL